MTYIKLTKGFHSKLILCREFSPPVSIRVVSNTEIYGMRLLRLHVVVLLLLAPVLGCGDVGEARQAQIVHLLRQDCGSCHGMTLRGGLGPALTSTALRNKSKASIEAVILGGRPGTPMPPWRGFLNAQEVQWLVEQLKSGVFDNDVD